VQDPVVGPQEHDAGIDEPDEQQLHHPEFRRRKVDATAASNLARDSSAIRSRSRN
jgi:hypothetical protein